jgi:hypothetical protein
MAAQSPGSIRSGSSSRRPGARRHAIGAEDVMGNPIPLNLLMDLGQAAVQVRRRAATRRRGGQQAQES